MTDATSGPTWALFTELQGLRLARLCSRYLEVDVLVDKGADVLQVRHRPSGVAVLAQPGDAGAALARYQASGRRSASYAEHYAGGWQDVLPARARWRGGGIETQSCGEAATLPWEAELAADEADGTALVGRVRLPVSGLSVEKRFSLAADRPELLVTTVVRNHADRPLRFSWTQHPAFNLGGSTVHLKLPGGRVFPYGARPASDAALEFAPLHAARRGEAVIDLRTFVPPADEPDTFFTVTELSAAWAELWSQALPVGVRLEWDGEVFPHLWYWAANRAGLRTIALEPSSTYLPDFAESEAAGLLLDLEPGERLRAWVSLSLIDTPTSTE